jgi:hypothetical protein
MRYCNTWQNRSSLRILPVACATALALASTPSLAQATHAEEISPPRVPASLQVPAGQEPFLVGHGVGSQNYICLPSGSGFAWSLFTPEATLFDGHNKQLITHFFSPNPFESGTIRATWESSRDTSTVWAQTIVPPSSDPNFVAPGAIPWLLLKVVGAQDGPTEGDTLTGTTYIQRVNTAGGSAPSTGCAQLVDVGNRAFVPYAADYFFYTSAAGH